MTLSGEENEEVVSQSSTETDSSWEGCLPSGKKATWLREGYSTDEEGNFLLGIDISSRMSRPGSQPLYHTYDDSSDRKQFGIHVPREIEMEAHKKAKETGDESEYVDHVGYKLNWTRKSEGDWAIPKDQMEILTYRQYWNLLKRDKR